MSTTTFESSANVTSTSVRRPSRIVAGIRGELSKALSLRSTWWCMAFSVLAMVALPAVMMLQRDLEANDLAIGSGLSLMVAMSMAAVLSTGDIANGTVRVARWANPARWHGYFARTLTGALLGGVIGLIGGSSLLALSTLTGQAASGAPLFQATLGQAVIFALACAVSSAIGTLLRRTAVAVASIILWIQIVETLLPALPNIGESIREWLPFMNAFMFTMPGNFGNPPHTPAFALCYFALFAVVVVTLSGFVATKRDD